MKKLISSLYYKPRKQIIQRLSKKRMAKDIYRV